MLMIWNMVERFLPIIIQFSAYIVITREVPPEDVGVVGVISLFIALSQVVIDGGMSTLVIRDQGRDRKLLSTVHYCSIFISIVLCALLALLSPVIENYLQINNLSRYLCFSLIVLPIAGSAVVSRSLMIINGRYKMMTLLALISSVVSFTISYFLFAKGLGIWSVITLSLVFNGLNSLLIIRYSKFNSGKYFEFELISKHALYIIKLLTTNLIDNLFRNIYPLIIAKYLNVYSAGIFTQSQKITELPSYNLYAVIYRFSLSKFSSVESLQNKKAEIIKYIFLVMSFSVVVYLLGYCYSLEVIVFLMGDKWVNMSNVFSYLLLSGLIFPLKAMVNAFLCTIGSAGSVLCLEIFNKSLLVINIVFSIYFGFEIELMALGVLVSSFITVILMVIIVIKAISRQGEYN
ncbi:oligosaccharide flippase family protein [Vibrio alginolyticus]|nr:oligosaccharide flippase family protein [Vibrio alginolyticus]